MIDLLTWNGKAIDRMDRDELATTLKECLVLLIEADEQNHSQRKFIADLFKRQGMKRAIECEV